MGEEEKRGDAKIEFVRHGRTLQVVIVEVVVVVELLQNVYSASPTT